MGVVVFSFFLAVMVEYVRKGYLAQIEKNNRELQAALENVRTLKGLLPICAWCKRIRNDKGYWDQIENYFSQRTEAEFSHGICPECESKQMEELRRMDKGPGGPKP